MLQRLEDFYLAILRFVVILVAGLLLVGVAVLGAKSVSALRPAPEPVKEIPQVSQEVLRVSLVAPAAGSDVSSSTQGASSIDTNQQFYTSTASSVKRFLDSNFPGQYNLDTTKFAGMVKEHAEAYESAELTSAYAKNLSETAAALLADPAVVADAKKNGAQPIIERLMTAFPEEFDRQVKKATAENESKQEAYVQEKVESQRNLYLAFAGFGIFLLIVFLSIIIRIERNLRPVARSAA